MRLFLLAKSDDEYEYEPNDVFIPVSTWHDNSLYRRSFEDVTYLPAESWLQRSAYFPPESSTSGTLTSFNSDDSLFWNHDIKTPQRTYGFDTHGALDNRVEERDVRNSSDGYGIRPPTLLGVDNSFAIDPEFSFLHGLCMPADSRIFIPQKEVTEQLQKTKTQPVLSSSSNDFSDSSAEPKSDPTSNSDEGASSGSKSSGQSFDPLPVLPDIGSDSMKTKSEVEKKIKLDQFDAILKEHIANQLSKLQKDPENVLKNLPDSNAQWENDHAVLPSIGNPPAKPTLRRCTNSEGSLRQRLGSELPTIWEDTSSPVQVSFFTTLRDCMSCGAV